MTTRTKPAITLREAAHDLNNLCSTILGFTALAEEADAQNGVTTAYLTEIRLSTEAIAAIAVQLRALSQELGTAGTDEKAGGWWHATEKEPSRGC